MTNHFVRTIAVAVMAACAGCFSGPEPLPPDQALAKAAERVDAILRDTSVSDAPAPLASPETPSNPGSVSFWFFQHPVYTRILSHPEILTPFREHNPNLKLTCQYIGEWNVAVQKLTVTVAAGDLPDIAMVKRPWLERLVHAGRIAPLDALFPSVVDDLRKPSRDALTVDGHVYALPADGYCSVLFYNRDLVGDTAPKTWEELKQAAAKVVKLAPGQAREKIIPVGDIPFLETLWSCGGDLTRNGRSGMSAPEARDALDFLFGLRGTGYAESTVLGNSERAFGLFLAGRAAMTVASSERIPQTSACGFKVGVAPIPGKTAPLSLLSDNVIVVFNRYAEAKCAGLAAVLELVTGPVLQGDAAAALGSTPVRTATAPAVSAALPGLDQAYQVARSTPLLPRWNEIEFETMRYLQLAYMWEDKKP